MVEEGTGVKYTFIKPDTKHAGHIEVCPLGDQGSF